MKIILMVSVLFFMTGCAAKKLAIKNADTLLEHQIEKRMPLNEKQEEVLAHDIDLFLNEMKPQARELTSLVDNISLETPETLEVRYEEILIFVKKVSLEFSKVIAKHMATLDEKQQKKFLANIKQENKKLKRKGVDQKVFKDRFKAFFGSVHASQDDLYKEYKSYFLARFQEKIDRRKELLNTFTTIYQAEKNPVVLQTRFNEAFVSYQNRPYQNEKSVELLKKLIPTLTLEQKQHFKETIRELRELIRYFLETDY